jgi:hypothetical protein
MAVAVGDEASAAGGEDVGSTLACVCAIALPIQAQAISVANPFFNVDIPSNRAPH